jgi:hypothetical protein
LKNPAESRRLTVIMDQEPSRTVTTDHLVIA